MAVIQMKKLSFLLGVLVFIFLNISSLNAKTPAEDLFGKMEQHLRQLRSLEVVYIAEGEAFPEGGQTGRMVWTRPDGFFHDSPEWTLAQHGDERWRYLKAQQTLILEDVREDDPLMPEQVLFALGRDVEPEALEAEPSVGDASKLTLRAAVEEESSSIWLWVREGAVAPFKLAWPLADGTIVTYRIETWREDIVVEDSLFVPPEAKQVINFRQSKESGGTR
jgi:outer membrane lipoprotein-sorting protein